MLVVTVVPKKFTTLSDKVASVAVRRTCSENHIVVVLSWLVILPE